VAESRGATLSASHFIISKEIHALLGSLATGFCRFDAQVLT